MKKGLRNSSLIGVILFFLSITVVVTVTVLVYAVVAKSCDGREGVIAVVMFFVIVFLSMVATLIDYLRRRAEERSVKKILDATNKIASGDFSTKIEINRSFKNYDAYDHIMENLNKMSAELSKTEVLRSDFISSVSHELKTPLAVIQNYATSLQKKNLDEQTREQYASTLALAAKRLTDLVANILKLNKLENQEIRPEYEKIDLTEMLTQTVIGFEELIENKGLELYCDIDENVEIVSSLSYLEIVWNNLLSNAIKFTESGGKISVYLKKTDGGAVVTVADTGCGISSETGEHIFEKFYQGDTSHAQEGNGLGLALVKKVIDLIGGSISVSSEVNKGTAFAVTLKVER
ncbi:MAG: HAMP domain-containing histidine kinase [Clostridia bacterium]|nr:HAMP domain-containing histidine kinase [Clostridia bacterium]MDE7329460.1 HAMP domain-containing histidine kinase [Clostridia bacterium]